MRIKDLSQAEMEDVIRKCQYCHIGMVDQEGKPYVLAMNFGYSDGVLYFHSAPEGKKLNILRNNPEVCVEFSADCELRFQSEDVACSYSMKYRSVLAYGKIEFVDGDEQKTRALDIIMKNYSPREFIYGTPAIRNVCCWRLQVIRFEGRSFGY